MSGMANPGWSKAKYAARESHLDKDAAGRLLESTSDRAPREMTVTMVLPLDRTRLTGLFISALSTVVLRSGKAILKSGTNI